LRAPDLSKAGAIRACIDGPDDLEDECDNRREALTQSIIRHADPQARYSGCSILILLDEFSFLVHWFIDFSPGQNPV